MTITVLDRAPVTGDAGRVTGERQERPGSGGARAGAPADVHRRV
jgi:hypothetical protein